MTFQLQCLLFSFLLLWARTWLNINFFMFSFFVCLFLDDSKQEMKFLFFCFSPVECSIFMAYLCWTRENETIPCAILCVVVENLNYDSCEKYRRQEFGLKLWQFMLHCSFIERLCSKQLTSEWLRFVQGVIHCHVSMVTKQVAAHNLEFEKLTIGTGIKLNKRKE